MVLRNYQPRKTPKTRKQVSNNFVSLVFFVVDIIRLF